MRRTQADPAGRASERDSASGGCGSAGNRSQPLVTELAPLTMTRRLPRRSRQPYYRCPANAITPQRLCQRIARTRCSTRTSMARSSGTGSSPTKRTRAVRCHRTEQRGGSRRTTVGSVRSGGPSAKRGRQPDLAVHDDICVIADNNGRIRHRFATQSPNELWLTDITDHRTAWIPAVVATPATRSGRCRRGQVIPLYHQGPVLRSDRRLFDRGTDEVQAGCAGARRCCRCAP